MNRLTRSMHLQFTMRPLFSNKIAHFEKAHHAIELTFGRIENVSKDSNGLSAARRRGSKKYHSQVDE